MPEGTDRPVGHLAATGRPGDMVRPAADLPVDTGLPEGDRPVGMDRLAADLRVVTDRRADLPVGGLRWAVRRDTGRRVMGDPPGTDLRREASGRRAARRA